MIIKSLSLKNIRSYTDAYIEFPSGSTLLSGDIGCGKSTLLLAIEFALFGIIRGDLDAAALLRTGTNKGSVSLTFAVAKTIVTITRGLIRGKQAITQDTGALIIDGVEEKLTATELRRRILEILAYPQVLVTKSPSLVFRYTTYTSQEQMKEILAQSAQERLQTLRAVFGIDNYSRIKENAQHLLRSIKERAAYLQGQLAAQGELHERIEAARKDQQDLSQKHKTATLQHAKAQEEDAQIDRQWELLQKTIAALVAIQTTAKRTQEEIAILQQEYRALCQRVDQTLLQQAALQKELDAAGTITLDLEIEQGLLEDKRRLQNQMQKIQADLQATVARLASVQAKIEAAANILKRRDELKTECTQLTDQEKGLQSQAMLQDAAQKELESLSQDIIRITAAHAAASMEKERLTIQLNHSHDGDVCELCMQPITHEQQKISREQKMDRLSHVMQAISAGEQDLTQLQTKRTALTRTVGKYQQTIAVLAQVQGRRKALEQELTVGPNDAQELGGHLQLIEQEHKILKAQSIQVTQELADIETKLEYVRAQKEKSLRLMSYQQRIADLSAIAKQQQADKENQYLRIEAKKDELGKLQTQLSNLDALQTQQQQLAKQRIEIKEKLQTAAHVMAQTAAMHDAARRAVEQLQVQITQLVAIRTEYERVNMQRQWISVYFCDLMDIIEQHVFTTVHSDFNSNFQRWMGMLLEDQSIAVSLDATLSPVVMQNGYDVSVDQLSGGEKTSVALAYRLALNRVVSDVFSMIKTKNLLILDEPTDGFSEEQLDRVRDVLTALPTGQLIIVSHEPKVETFVDHVLRVQKQNHVSMIAH